jgi:hypothetical protein
MAKERVYLPAENTFVITVGEAVLQWKLAGLLGSLKSHMKEHILCVTASFKHPSKRTAELDQCREKIKVTIK